MCFLGNQFSKFNVLLGCIVLKVLNPLVLDLSSLHYSVLIKLVKSVFCLEETQTKK